MTADNAGVTSEITACGPDDATLVAEIIGEAFADLAVTQWLVPESQQRQPVLTRNMLIHVQHALSGHGQADRIGDVAVAVWFPHGDEPLPEPADYDSRLTAACGTYTPAFRKLDELFAEHHPEDEPHHHLAFMAVRPTHQGRGYGSALLNHHHRQHPDVPAYLEASSVDSRRLYRSHGYLDLDGVLTLQQGGPYMYPMWRAARHE